MNRWFDGAARDVRRLSARAADRARPLARRLTGGRWPAPARRIEVRGIRGFGSLLAGTAIGATLAYVIGRRRKPKSNVAQTVRRGRAVAEQQFRNARSKVAGRL